MRQIRFTTFDEFCSAVHEIGFLPGSFPWSDGGLFSVRDFCTEGVTWHNGNPETDPWMWRVRAAERDDMAYAKLFNGKTGYISMEWYPYFLAARRQGDSFLDAYEAGEFSAAAKKIFSLLEAHPSLSVYELKTLGGFRGEEGRGYGRAILDLQMRMYITVAGEVQKLNRLGQPYGWPGAVFATVERRFGEDIVLRSEAIDAEEAEQRIAARVLEMAPGAAKKEIDGLIYG